MIPIITFVIFVKRSSYSQNEPSLNLAALVETPELRDT
jgi:hypothetical protein